MSMKSISLLCFIFALGVAVSPCLAVIGPVTGVTTDNPPGSPPYSVQSVTVGAYTVDVSGLTWGTSTTTLDPVNGVELPALDDAELGTQYSSGEPTDAYTVHMFGGRLWTNDNGDEPDFFVFEAGGQDNPVYAAILLGGAIGQGVTIPASDGLWGSLGNGYDAPSNGQQIYGVSFAITDLLDADGNPLTNDSIIEGIAVTSRNGLDPSDWFSVASAPILAAMNPTPADGALYPDTWANLGWLAGETAASHDIYISESFDNVNDRTAEAFRGNQPSTFIVVGFVGFPFPDGLVPGTTYYWAVDEVEADGATKHKGPVWSFTVPPRTAYNPDPVDGAMADTDVTLSWTAGFGAKLHTVYFGDSFDDVNNATAGTAVATTAFAPGTLELDKTYYWRVDELNPPTTIKGNVWSFTTLPDIPITDPNLVGWWKFDEGRGTLAVDWSGHGNHGAVNGNPKWVDGQIGGAMEFGGAGDFVDCGTDSILHFTFTGTVIAWIKLDGWTTVEQTLIGKGGSHWALRREENTDRMLWYCNEADTADAGGDELPADARVDDGLWHHVAGVYDGSQMLIYVDGILNASVAATRVVEPHPGDALWIGGDSQRNARFWTGSADDVRVYNKALTVDEIKQAMRGDLLAAWDPSPANNSTSDILRAASVSWSPGDSASQHAVYFGADRDAVAGADTSDTTGVFRGLQAGISYTPPEGVEWAGGPYYWRIDEHNTDGTVTKGNIWSFSVADYLIVDDFESYNDIPAGEPGSNLVYVAWLDGFGTTTNGSTMGYVTGASLETGNVHGGAKSVPFAYNNAAAGVSEVVRTFTPAQDWTKHGVTTLSLWFAGADTNVAGQLYVKVNGVQVNYDGDAGNLALPDWQSWNIDLTSIGLNASSVTSLAIGIQGPGATGALLLDDIRLTAPTP